MFYTKIWLINRFYNRKLIRVDIELLFEKEIKHQNHHI